MKRLFFIGLCFLSSFSSLAFSKDTQLTTELKQIKVSIEQLQTTQAQLARSMLEQNLVQDPVRRYYWIYSSVIERDDTQMIGWAQKSLQTIKKQDQLTYDWMVYYTSQDYCKTIDCDRQASLDRLLKRYPNNIYFHLQNGTTASSYTYETGYQYILPRLVLNDKELTISNSFLDEDQIKEYDYIGLPLSHVLAFDAFAKMTVYGDFDGQQPCMQKQEQPSEACRSLFVALMKNPNANFQGNQLGWMLLKSYCKRNSCSQKDQQLLTSQNHLIQAHMKPQSWPLYIRQMAWSVNHSVAGNPLCMPLDFKQACYKGPTETNWREKWAEAMAQWFG